MRPGLLTPTIPTPWPRVQAAFLCWGERASGDGGTPEVLAGGGGRTEGQARGTSAGEGGFEGYPRVPGGRRAVGREVGEGYPRVWVRRTRE